jgi:hypothetical protein
MIPGDAESIGGGKLADLRVIVRGEIFRSIADSSMGASWSPLPTFNRASASFGRMTPAELPTGGDLQFQHQIDSHVLINIGIRVTL